MHEERNTSQEQAGAFNAPEGVSAERLAQRDAVSQSVEDRAREIARIEGRPDDVVWEEDRQQALEELSSVPSERPETPSRDQVAPSFPADLVEEGDETAEEDEQLIAEEQARRGVREAEHNTMFQEREEGKDRTEDL